MSKTRLCWCGNADLQPFSPEYRSCRVCGTLVSQVGLDDTQLVVADDDTDFYGKQYWLGHQADDLGFPDIRARSRNDLTERNLHWLRTLLKYRLPPAATLELGCAHGSFVALMRQCGYEASGVEMSPWVVEYGRHTFEIPVQTGPVESLQLPAGSLDVIALMDVLEHLPDPVATMRHCLGLLKPDGLLLIQTPCFDEQMRHDNLVASASPFLDQLKSDEHLYLMSQRALVKLFDGLGAAHLAFEPPMFPHYDMFAAVSRNPLQPATLEQVEQALAANPRTRMVQALLDLRDRELDLTRRLKAMDADRETLTEAFRQADSDRIERDRQVSTLTALLRESEADRAARGEQIVTLTALAQQAQAQVADLQRKLAATLEGRVRRLLRGRQ
jgi:SAM-dependent methyltransferase